MKQSIYEQIHSAVNKNGQLDSDFSLPSEDTNGDIIFTPGAWDGMLRYHLSTNEQDIKVELQHWASIIEIASKRQVDQAILEAEQYGLNHSIYLLSDEIVRYLMNHENSLNLDEIIYFGIQLLLKANKKEAVKLGFLLLELFELEDLEIYKPIIRTLALYDEFTFYAGFHMQNWENGNQEIFDAAKKVTGWGRIHLVDKLKPETEEIKLWLLTEGINNDVMPDYSALTIYHKADLIDHLKAPIDYDLYHGISHVISALLSEEPVVGISAIEEKEELLGTFLQVARSRKDLRTEDYSAILDAIDYVSDKESLLHLKKEGDELINDSVKKKILQETKKGNSFGLAIRLDLPYEADQIRNGALKIFDAHFAAKGATFRENNTAKGNMYFILQESDAAITYLQYDRDSRNGRCGLYVLWKASKSTDGSWSPNDAQMQNTYAYEYRTGTIAESGKTDWSDTGSEEYRKLTGEP